MSDLTAQPTVEALADVVRQRDSSGMCHYGRECELCDCDQPRYDREAMEYARDIHALLPGRPESVVKAEALAPAIAFINERPQYINAMKNTPGDGDQTDYYRWSGGAEARRQLATALGLPVPHEYADRIEA